ncbi:hypothetical protein CRYUN_Cryun16bG0088100 [Craigia yunnanensis]
MQMSEASDQLLDLRMTKQHWSHNHPLVLAEMQKNGREQVDCLMCEEPVQGSSYYCCTDYIKCALLPQVSAGDFSKLQHSSHVHSLIFTPKKKSIVKLYPCAACKERTPGPIYSCADCEFYIHKKCAELPPKITHTSHRKHTLVLLTNATPHQEMCSCHLCKNNIKGFIYHCSLCEFDLKIKHIFSSQIEIGSHEHPFNLVSKPVSFICDACGTGGDCIPY